MIYAILWSAALMTCAQAQTAGVIAYTHAPDGGPPWPVEDVHTVQADGSYRRALTNDGHSHHASWSPDGKRILFIHDSTLSLKPAYRETEEHKSHHPIELSIMDADGRNRRVLRVIEPVIYSASWSPDGKVIAISAVVSASTGLYLLPADGPGELRLLIPDAWTPSWSPDGKKLAFSVEAPRGEWNIHIADANGANNIRLTNGGAGSGSPAWSPDGTRIAFERFTGIGGRQQVFVMNTDGSDLRQVTTDTAWSCGHPAWSPEGAQLVVACRSAASPCGMGVSSTGQPMPECTRRLFLVPAKRDAKPRQLTDHDGAFPSFAP
jgi:Tol biopolymer transport system component